MLNYQRVRGCLFSQRFPEDCCQAQAPGGRPGQRDDAGALLQGGGVPSTAHHHRGVMARVGNGVVRVSEIPGDVDKAVGMMKEMG